MPIRILSRGLCVLAAAPLLLSCGGEVVATLGYIPAAGGQYSVDDDAGAGYTERRCFSTAAGTDARCGLTLVITPNAAGTQETDALYASRYAVTANGALKDDDADCANVTGTVDGRRLQLGSCFTGEFASVNEVVSTDGRSLRLVVDFFPNMREGVWVDIHDDRRRFKFDNGATGCELTDAGRTGVALDITVSDVTNTNGTGVIPHTRMTAFTIQRAGAPETWSGTFEGASALRLTRDGRTLELERRRDDGNTTCAPPA